MDKILILGANGLLGHVLFNRLSLRNDLEVYATVRMYHDLPGFFKPSLLSKLISRIDSNLIESIGNLLTNLKPDVVINCIGIVKQLPDAIKPIPAITTNALFPHKLAQLCTSTTARLIHFSTDCVFSGQKGNYIEGDFSDANDLYGRTKSLGELHDPHCVTLRTSIIGHELKSKNGLIEWFLNEEKKVKGFTNAIFTGFPTVEMARILTDYVIPNDDLSGLYHVSSDPISKYNLLKLVAKQYGHKIKIEPEDTFTCNRSLNSTKFRAATGYIPPSWEKLVTIMHNDFVENYRR